MTALMKTLTLSTAILFLVTLSSCGSSHSNGGDAGTDTGGEGGTTPAPAVVINAIVHALGDFDIRDIPMPASPFTIWQVIQKAKAEASN
jgi:hypothetical protein